MRHTWGLLCTHYGITTYMQCSPNISFGCPWLYFWGMLYQWIESKWIQPRSRLLRRERPTTATEIGSFLGLAAYYKTFIQGWQVSPIFSSPSHTADKKGEMFLVDWCMWAKFSNIEGKAMMTFVCTVMHPALDLGSYWCPRQETGHMWVSGVRTRENIDTYTLW